MSLTPVLLTPQSLPPLTPLPLSLCIFLSHFVNAVILTHTVVRASIHISFLPLILNPSINPPPFYKWTDVISDFLD